MSNPEKGPKDSDQLVEEGEEAAVRAFQAGVPAISEADQVFLQGLLSYVEEGDGISTDGNMAHFTLPSSGGDGISTDGNMAHFTLPSSGGEQDPPESV